jgi:uncharacterized membrane protein (UPF0182 family)
MSGFITTVTLALTVFLFLLVVGTAGWHFRRGRNQRDRVHTLRGYTFLGFLGLPLLLLIWPHVAYLWTETLWYQQFRLPGPDAAPARYDRVFWRILGMHWRIWALFALAGTAFLLLNVLIAKWVCPITVEAAAWTTYRTRAAHRLLAVVAFFSASVPAFFLMTQWETFAGYAAYRAGVGCVPALVQTEAPRGGTAAYPAEPSPWAASYRDDIEAFGQAVDGAVHQRVQSMSLVALHSPKVTPGHRPPAAHYTVRGYLLPLVRDRSGKPLRYRASVEVSGPTVLERVEVAAKQAGREMKRRIRTGENYTKYQTFETDVDRRELAVAAQALVRKALESKYLRNGFTDPIFFKNVGYYLFEYPALRLLSGWAKLVVLLAIAFVAYQYRFYYHRDTHSMQRAVQGVAVHGTLLWILLLGISIWRSTFAREGLLFSGPSPIESGRIPVGVSFTDYAQISAYRVYIVVLIVLMGVLFVNAFVRNRRVWIAAGVGWPVAYVLILWAYPAVLFVVKVRPNPLRAERVFVQNHIAMTRRAFNLDSIQTSRAVRKLAQYEDLLAHPEVLANVQLWDRRVIWERLQQSHAHQRYYEFSPYPDVDRYAIGGQLRQVIIAARELNPEKLTTKEGLSKRLKYTHGYGVVLAPVNMAKEPGVPEFWVKGIPPKAPNRPEFAPLAIQRPQIYFGELSNDYVFVKSEEREMDYPIEGEFALTEYAGHGGVPIGKGLRRIAFATRLREPLRVALSSALTEDSRLLLHRNIVRRARRLAPFLEFDPDPFLVIGKDSGRLWWVIDLYTISKNYPYAQAYRQLDTKGVPIGDLGGELADEPDLRRFNYVRNAAVAVIDPYEGDVFFYVTDKRDPLMRVYMRFFPELFQDAEKMPEEIRSHLRYPDWLTWVQGSMYALYHVEDPVIFVTGGDAWKLPQEKFHSDTLQPMLPYYTVLTLPGEDTPEFVSVLPFSPPATTKRLTAWLVARSDGDNYGALVAYTLSRSEEVDGPEQVENRIDQDTELSGQFTLLGTAGSEVIRGNLLLLPCRTRTGEDALFYVEPVYLRATVEEGQSMPELKFVIVVADDKLASDKTFDVALRKVFNVGLVGIVQGRVTTGANNPVRGAVLALVNEKGELLPNPGTTEPDGRYRIENVPPGKYKVRIAREGFLAQEGGPLEVQIGLVSEHNASLKPAPPPPPPPPRRPLEEIAKAANVALDNYYKFMGEGKPVDAARALEDLRRHLQDLALYVERTRPKVSMAP